MRRKIFYKTTFNKILSDADIVKQNFNEPSGFTVSESDRADYALTDVSYLYVSEITFLARGLRMGKWHIVKGLNPEFQDQDFYRMMLRKEFETLIELQHPYIRRVYSFEVIESLGPCIVMEYVEGKPLGKWLTEKHTSGERFRVALELTEAVDYIHRKGFVHRDIKPDNIIITEIGQSVKLIDFGLSDSGDNAFMKHPAGTKGFISPEQAQSDRPDIRNDIYSLGVVLGLLLPEKRFKRIVDRCLREADRRPRNAGEVGLKLQQTERIWRYLPPTAVIVLILSVIVILLSSRSSSLPEQSSETRLNEKIAVDSVVNESLNAQPEKPATIIRGEEKSEAAPMIEKETSQYSGNAESSKPTVTMYITQGESMLDLIWENSALRFIDTVSNSSVIPETWDLSELRRGKHNFLIGLRYRMENDPESGLSDKEMAEIESHLNEYLESFDKKWKKLVKQRK